MISMAADALTAMSEVVFPGRVTREQGQKLLETAVERLSGARAVLELGRSSTSGAPVVEDVMRTNTFGVTVGGVEFMALFPRISVSEGSPAG